MTIPQIKNKIENLEYWLTNNPAHPQIHNVLNDKKALELELMILENPNP